MYVSMQARRPGAPAWKWMAIDDMLIDIVTSAAKGDTSLIYDEDDILQWEVNLPYHELLAHLNGTDVPEPPKQPVEVVAWASVGPTGKSAILYTYEAGAVAHCTRCDYLCQVVKLTGTMA